MLPSVQSQEPARAAWARPEQTTAIGYVGPRKTIMIVDDDLDHLRLLETVLKPMGFLVQTASNGDAAVNILGDISPDLFVLDIDMPGMTGWDLAQTLRTMSQHRASPIMMVTGHALEARQPVDRQQLYDAFIVKPYSLNDFLARAAGLMRIDLVVDEDNPTCETAPVSAPPEALGRIIRLAEIGHAAGVKREVDALSKDGVIGQDIKDPIQAHLREFDLPAVAKLLREVLRNAS